MKKLKGKPSCCFVLPQLLSKEEINNDSNPLKVAVFSMQNSHREEKVVWYARCVSLRSRDP